MQQVKEIVMNIENRNEEVREEELIRRLKKSEEEIEQGKGIDSDIAFKELRQKYGY